MNLKLTVKMALVARVQTRISFSICKTSRVTCSR